MSKVILVEHIETKVFVMRGQKVMLDIHLAEFYGVKTKRFNEQVRRNIKRFPQDFMFRLSKNEWQNLRSQFATSSLWGGHRYLPFAFTEQGIAMLSGVLHSDRAIKVNIVIMRAFVKFRQMIAANKDLAEHLSQLEKRMDKKDREVIALFEAIRQLMREEAKPKNKIGFHGRL